MIKIIVNEVGIRWLKDKQYHREDGPATEYPNSKAWWINGYMDRDNEPAVIYSNGTKEYWKHGRLYRENGPTIEFADGSTYFNK